MNKRILLLCFTGAVLLTAAPRAHARSTRVLPGSGGFDRRFDPVVIKAGGLGPYIGYDISHLRLYRVAPGHDAAGLQPIPFQIDERDEKGDWIFNYDSQGKPIPLKRTVLAPRDELVFMAKDAGARLQGTEPGVKGDGSLEIELTDPINNTHAYVYLVFFKANPPPPSPVTYVRYDPIKDMVYGTFYTMGFSKKSPVSYDYFAVPKSEGGEDVNIFDRFKMRLDVDASLFSLHRDEDQFKSRLIGYIQGPVRVVRRVANSMDVIWGIQSGAVLSDSMYYYDYFQFPTIVDIPIDMKKLFIVKKARLVTTTDFNHNAIGMYFYNSNNPKGLEITGTMSKAQQELNRGPYDWAVVAGPQGAWMNRVVMGKDVPFIKDLYYVDDKTKLDPPENEPGQIGSTGYDFGNLLKADKGTYHFISYIYVPIGYRPGDEKPWLNIIDHPIEDMVYHDGKQVKTVKAD